MARKRAATNQTDDVSVMSLPSKKRRTETVQAPAVPTFYVNNVALEASSWDVRLRLGQIEPGTPDVLPVADVAHIFMSHGHFRKLAETMAAFVLRIDAIEAMSKKLEEEGDSDRG